jgi:hypothetical protein
MEASGRKWRIGVALGLLAGLVVTVLVLRGHPESERVPPAVPAGLVAVGAPGLEFGRLYDLDHLVIDGDPLLELHEIAPVGAGPGASPPVPEPGAAALWILGFAALYALYLPAGSW